MWIIFLVAASAISREFVAIEWANVARFAFGLCVSAAQRKLRRPVMIEVDLVPLVGLVAGLAFTTVVAGVFVVDLVA